MKSYLFGEGLTDKTLKTYAEQRFDAPRFLPLVAYLLLYARPYVPNLDGNTTFLSIMLVGTLLFCFRLFDDLASWKVDAGKPDRIYTDRNSHAILRNFLIVFSAILIGIIWIFNADAAVALLTFSVFNLIAYSLLFKTWTWRFILPLLKYPFLCFLLYVFFKNEAISTHEILISASLFPAFLLFEIFDDENFSFKNQVIFSIFLAGNLLLLFASPASVFGWIFAGIGVIIFTLILKDTTRFKTLLPYTILIYFLIVRVLVQL